MKNIKNELIENTVLNNLIQEFKSEIEKTTELTDKLRIVTNKMYALPEQDFEYPEFEQNHPSRINEISKDLYDLKCTNIRLNSYLETLNAVI
jgi:uncharacterized coiled-coil protein SlyX